MSTKELRMIITNGGKLLNVNFDKIANYIVSLSAGQSAGGAGRPGTTHDLCLHAVRAVGISETLTEERVITAEEFDKALVNWCTVAGPHIKIKFDEFFENPPKGVPAGICDRVCSLLAESDIGGLALKDVEEHLAQEFSISVERCKSILREMIDVEDGIFQCDETSQYIKFALPLYLAFFRKNPVQVNDFALQDLARDLWNIIGGQR